MIKPIYQDQTALILGTGPSITKEVIKSCNAAKVSGVARLFGCNLTFKDFDLDVLAATNSNFWDYYWHQVKGESCDKWTPHKKTADKYGINYIEERGLPGLSTDPAFIHHHHGSGPITLNIALHYGITRMLLVGWDMRHKGSRHFFGEYPEPLVHYTRNLGEGGELNGLLGEMATIDPEKYGIEIINCTPNSALKHFPMGELKDFI